MTRIHSIDVDPKSSSAYVYFEAPAPGLSTKQINVGDAVIFDLASDGRLIGIEILDPRLAGKLTEAETAEALRAAKIPVRVGA